MQHGSRRIMLLAIPSLLSACAAGSSQSTGADRWVPIQPSSAVVTQPSDPALIVAVRERRRDGTEVLQNITLVNDTYLAGENSLSVAVELDGPFLKLTRAGESLGQYELKGQALEAAIEQALPAGWAGKGGLTKQMNRVRLLRLRVSNILRRGAVRLRVAGDRWRQSRQIDRSGRSTAPELPAGRRSRPAAGPHGLHLTVPSASVSTQSAKAD